MKHLVTMLALALTLSACKGPEGPVGPQGDEGPVGPQGPPGSTNMKTLTFSYTSNDLTYEESIAGLRVDAPLITQAVYDGGAVLAYYDLDGIWMALPWTLSSGMESVEITYAYAPGAVTLLFISNWETIYSTDIPSGRVRIVAMPPSAGKAAIPASIAHKAEYSREMLDRLTPAAN